MKTPELSPETILKLEAAGFKLTDLPALIGFLAQIGPKLVKIWPMLVEIIEDFQKLKGITPGAGTIPGGEDPFS